MHDELNQSTLTLGPAYCGRFTRLSSYSISGAGPNQHTALGRVTKNYEVAVSRHFDDRPPAKENLPRITESPRRNIFLTKEALMRFV